MGNLRIHSRLPRSDRLMKHLQEVQKSLLLAQHRGPQARQARRLVQEREFEHAIAAILANLLDHVGTRSLGNPARQSGPLELASRASFSMRPQLAVGGCTP